jgi:hypothetical protein
MLGRAMDFFIPGVPLETQREAGLRLQRGGVGYYPSSGSPFIHLDVGSVRMWPRMSRAQLVKVFPDGRTVHVPTDGQPLPGYALALADIEKRGSSAPSESSLASARDAGVNVDTAVATAPRQRNLFSALFTSRDEDDDREAAAAAPAPKQDTKPEPKAEKKADKPKQAAIKVAEAVPLPVARPTERIAAKVEPKPAPPAASFNLASADSRPVALAGPKAETTGAVAPWPVKVADAGGGVPAGLALAYSAPTAPAPAAPVTRGLTVPSTTAQNAAAALPVRLADAGSEAAPIHTASAAMPTHRAGLPPDDLWLRALVLAPDLRNYLTATVLGQSDMRELLPLMVKPDTVVTMGFGDDPNLGLATDRFTGAAVVFVPTTVFEKKRTAALQ